MDNQSSLDFIIQQTFSKSLRDPNRNNRLIAVVCTFNMIEKFSKERNKSAPILYKMIIF